MANFCKILKVNWSAIRGNIKSHIDGVIDVHIYNWRSNCGAAWTWKASTYQRPAKINGSKLRIIRNRRTPQDTKPITYGKITKRSWLHILKRPIYWLWLVNYLTHWEMMCIFDLEMKAKKSTESVEIKSRSKALESSICWPQNSREFHFSIYSWANISNVLKKHHLALALVDTAARSHPIN